MISNISFKGIEHYPKRFKKQKSDYQTYTITTDSFVPSSKEPKTKTTIFRAIADAVVDFCNKISQNLDNETPNSIVIMSDEEKKDYFNDYLFSYTANEKTTYERLIALDLFEKYGFDLYKNTVDFNTSENINFFKFINKDTDKRLQKRYIEVFKKFTQINPEDLTKEMIDSMYFPMDIKNVEEAIKKLGNNKKAKEMQKLFAENIEKLQKKPGYFLRNNFLKSIEKYLYPSLNITQEEKQAAYKKFGAKYGSNLLNKVFYPLSKPEMLALANFASSSMENYKYCMDNLEYLVLLSNSGSIIQNSKLKPESFELVVENAKDFINGDTNKDTIDAVIDYTNNGTYGTINGVPRFFAKIDEVKNALVQKKSTQDIELKLKELKNIAEDIYRLGDSITYGIQNRAFFLVKIGKIKTKIEKNDYTTEDILKDLDELKSLVLEEYKNSQIEHTTNILNSLLDKKTPKSEQVEFIRYEGKEILNQLAFSQNQLDTQKDDEALLEFLNREKPTLIQPSYTSTSVSPYFIKIKNQLVWTLKNDENAKGRYLNDIRNIFNNYSKTPLRKRSEAEFLFAPNAKLKIENAKLDKSGFKIEATITHDA